MIIEDFLYSFKELEEHSLNATYSDVVNDVDGITYPEICPQIPFRVADEVSENLSRIYESEVRINYMFLRRSPLGVECPNHTHHDLSMGTNGCLVYINDLPETGTSFQRHINTGISYAPRLEEFAAILQNDSNKLDKWQRTDFVQCRPNRSFCFDTGMMHRAEPPEGAGEGENARVVLIAFFDVIND